MYTPQNPKSNTACRVEELNKAWGKISGMKIPTPEKEALMKARITRSGLGSFDATVLQDLRLDPMVEALWKKL